MEKKPYSFVTKDLTPVLEALLSDLIREKPKENGLIDFLLQRLTKMQKEKEKEKEKEQKVKPKQQSNDSFEDDVRHRTGSDGGLPGVISDLDRKRHFLGRRKSSQNTEKILEHIVPIRKEIERTLSKPNLASLLIGSSSSAKSKQLSPVPVSLSSVSNSSSPASPSPGLGGIRRDLSFILTENAVEGFDEDGNETVNQFITVGTLGEGSFGKVKLAIDRRTDRMFAIKILRKSFLRRQRHVVKQQKQRRIQMETAYDQNKYAIALMKKLKHPNVVRLFEVIDDPGVDLMYMVMEYVERGPVMMLEEGMKCEVLREEDAWKYFVDIIAGLEYIHESKVVHRDLKPENLLVTKDDRVKISDFGESFMFEGDDANLVKTRGSPAFFAPEVAASTSFGKSIDIWAVGVCLYCFIFGHVPFWSENIIELFEIIKYKPVVFDKDINPLLKDLLERLLEKDPKKRANMAEIKMHKWYNKELAEKRLESYMFSPPKKIEVTKNDVDDAVSVISMQTLGVVLNAKNILKNTKRGERLLEIVKTDDEK